MKTAIAGTVSLRDLEESDIPMILDYWYHGDVGYLEAMGVDPLKMPSETQFKQTLEEKICVNAKKAQSALNAVIITLDGRPIGLHSVNPLVEGDYGVMHAHIIDKDLRGQGVARQSYLLAIRLFMDRFILKRMVFKTPVQNRGANRVKEVLGIRCLGEEVAQDFNILKDGTRTKVYEVTREELNRGTA